MSVNKKYFFLRLKENYFEQDAIVLLESMPDGILYSNILLKLYLKSLKHDGKLQLDEGIPLTTPMLAALFRQQVGTIEHALKIFAELGLVERLDNGVLYMTNIELLVGHSSTEGERKRRARKALQRNPQALPEAGADICPPELEREKELELELEPELEREREKAPEALPPARALLGKYHNVSLSSAELDALKRDLPEKWQIACPAIWRPAVRRTRTTQPRSINGPRRTQRKRRLRQKRAAQRSASILTKQAKACDQQFSERSYAHEKDR